MFRDGWVEESADEIEDIEKIDFRKREERIKNLRIEALREIMAQRGLAGILELSERGKASWVIGVLAASAVLSEQELQELLAARARADPRRQGRGSLIQESHRRRVACPCR